MSTIQNIFQEFYPQYKEKYKQSMNQIKAANDILKCKTAELGGHKYECEKCGHSVIQYNSCRNRHCPSCQGINKEIWVDQRRKDILDAPYYHVVFTMPKQLHMLIYHNQKLLYDLMFKAVAETLLELAADNKYLGAQIGFFSVLHTWGQDLHYHPHIHSVVLAGGLSKEGQWRMSGKDFFIPVRVLSALFRGKFLHYLRQYYKMGELQFYNEAQIYQNPNTFKELINHCYTLNWYSYTKQTFSGPLAVMKYLGRYTHRIAISNQRILSIDENYVKFQVKDYKNQNHKGTVTLKGIEFIRRFFMHILPKRFVKLRHYGILANRNKNTKLARCKKITKSSSYKPLFEGKSRIEIVSILFKKDVTLCPACHKGHLLETYLKRGVP